MMAKSPNKSSTGVEPPKPVATQGRKACLRWNLGTSGDPGGGPRVPEQLFRRCTESQEIWNKKKTWSEIILKICWKYGNMFFCWNLFWRFMRWSFQWRKIWTMTRGCKGQCRKLKPQQYPIWPILRSAATETIPKSGFFVGFTTLLFYTVYLNMTQNHGKPTFEWNINHNKIHI